MTQGPIRGVIALIIVTNHRLAIDDRELEESRITCETNLVREDHQTLGHVVESPESGLLLSVCQG